MYCGIRGKTRLFKKAGSILRHGIRTSYSQLYSRIFNFKNYGAGRRVGGTILATKVISVAYTTGMNTIQGIQAGAIPPWILEDIVIWARHY